MRLTCIAARAHFDFPHNTAVICLTPQGERLYESEVSCQKTHNITAKPGIEPLFFHAQ